MTFLGIYLVAMVLLTIVFQEQYQAVTAPKTAHFSANEGRELTNVSMAINARKALASNRGSTRCGCSC
jgi:hypothetical protein